MTDQADECAAATTVALSEMFAYTLEVDVLSEEEGGGEQSAEHQQKKRGQELLQSQRVTGLVLLFTRLTAPGHPIAPESLQVTCRMHQPIISTNVKRAKIYLSGSDDMCSLCSVCDVPQLTTTVRKLGDLKLKS